MKWEASSLTNHHLADWTHSRSIHGYARPCSIHGYATHSLLIYGILTSASVLVLFTLGLDDFHCGELPHNIMLEGVAKVNVQERRQQESLQNMTSDSSSSSSLSPWNNPYLQAWKQGVPRWNEYRMT